MKMYMVNTKFATKRTRQVHSEIHCKGGAMMNEIVLMIGYVNAAIPRP
jgi:hypothetical protein